MNQPDDRIMRVLMASQDNGKKKYYLPLSLLIISLVFLAGFYFIHINQSKAPAPVAVKNDAQTLIAEVSKLIALPQDEVPTIATVSDLEALKSQIFFANATLGDKVLIYTKAKKAILYDPVNKKIIEVAPLNIK